MPHAGYVLVDYQPQGRRPEPAASLGSTPVYERFHLAHGLSRLPASSPRLARPSSPGSRSSVIKVAKSLSQNVRSRHAEQMIIGIESVALELFEERGFAEVTVEEIAVKAGISPRTFYRHFGAKDDIFQVRIEQGAEALRAALGDRPVDESPLASLREAFVEVLAAEDEGLRRRWMLLVESSPALVRTVVGGIHLKLHTVMAEFFGARLAVASDDLVPTMLAAAAGGVLLATNTRWFLEGGPLAERIDEALHVLETLPTKALPRGHSPDD